MKKSISIICLLTILISVLAVFNVIAVDNRAIEIYEQSSPHNSFYTAQEICQDYTLNGRITTALENDYYSVVFSDSGKVNFWLGDIPSSCDYDLYIYDYSYNLVRSSTGSSSQEIVSNYSVIANRVYYILVKSASGHDTNNYYKLRCKWYPQYGYTYYYNKNPASSIGGFSVLNMDNLTTRSGYNIVNEIKESGCFVSSYAMILDNLCKNTGIARFNPRTGRNGIMVADPVSVTLANMDFPTLYSDNVLNDIDGTPVSIRNPNNIASYFYSTFYQYNLSGMSTNQKIIAITYYLTLHPEGIILRFRNSGGQHELVATNSAYVASEYEISSMLSSIQVMRNFDSPTNPISYSSVNENARYSSTSGYINDNNGGNYFTVYDPAYYGSSVDGSLTLSETWTAQAFSWSNLTYIEAFD